ncbi:DUF5615 family PIN-like protein [Bacteroidota bacterium]
MKFLIDAQLPESISDFFNGCDIVHTNSLEKGNQTKDSIINRISIKEKRAVITKDTDFYYSYLTNRKPFRLVLVKLGNMRLSEINQYFKVNSKKIIELLNKHYFIILEKNRIRILE